MNRDREGLLQPEASWDPGTARMVHPVLMMLLVLLLTVGLTYFLDAGEYERRDKRVVPGTYQVIPKPQSLSSLLLPDTQKTDQARAYPASLWAPVTSISSGMARAAPLIFMIMFIGGMFGVLRKSGALDAGVERLLVLSRGNVYLLVPALMLVIAAGSTFVGLISEYLLIIPVLVLLAERLKLGALFAVGLVTLSAKIGYLASVTNPIALGVAQPLLGLPLLSGAGLRLAIFLLYLPLGIVYLLWYVRRTGYVVPVDFTGDRKLSRRHCAVLLMLAICLLGMVVGTNHSHWDIGQLSSFYIGTGALLAVTAGMSSNGGVEAFLDGMKSMVLPGVLVGLAETVRVLLEGSHVLDTVIYILVGAVQGSTPVLVAESMLAAEMLLDVLIPSTSGKAAVSMPLFGPIGELSGVNGQCVLLAFLFGNGLMNMITPTSGMLLAYLATAQVGYGVWFRFILPLFLFLTALSILILALAVKFGYI